MANRTAIGLVFLVAAHGFVGCDGSTPSAPSPRPPSSFVVAEPRTFQPGPNTVRSDTVPASNSGIPGVDRFDVVMSRSGTAMVTLTWPNGDFSLQLYVTSGECANTASLVTGECTVLGRTRQGTLPGVITSPVVGGDAVTVWVLNPDEWPQTFIVDVEIT